MVAGVAVAGTVTEVGVVIAEEELGAGGAGVTVVVQQEVTFQLQTHVHVVHRPLRSHAVTRPPGTMLPGSATDVNTEESHPYRILTQVLRKKCFLVRVLVG